MFWNMPKTYYASSSMFTCGCNHCSNHVRDQTVSRSLDYLLIFSAKPLEPLEYMEIVMQL